uniref:podocalyxin isoform X2 n=1 Tax=Callithrix jacchus TaxID=9483 RepID=UPI0023DD4DE0|nr:podocalyxin isoform X2 [Callithrix jacchus]
MRCALVLSALLLLLLPPPPALSLSQNYSHANDSLNGTAPMAAEASSRQDQAPTAAVTTEARAAVQQSTVLTPKAPVKANITNVASDSGTAAPVQQDKVTSTVPGKADSGSPPATSDDPKGMKDTAGTTVAPFTTTAQPDATTSQDGAKDPATSGDQSSHNVTIDLTTIKAEHRTTPQPTDPVSTPQPTQMHLVATPTSSGQDHLMTASSGSSTAAGTDHTFTSPGMTATLPSSVPSQRTQQTSSQMPANSTAPLSQETVQPTSPAMASRTSPFPETTSSNPTAGSTIHQVPQTPSPTSAHGNNWVTPAGVGQIKCEAPETPNEKQLILNFTGHAHCAGGPPDEKLVTLICRAVKATFNPAQDECSIRLAPVLGSQAVAVKEITIHTKLPPKDVYERLKDKWDELKEAGVSHMQLGDQGPPEEAEDRFSMPLIITIVCMASFLLLVAALYGCCHQRLSQRKDQQRLTEELQTVENGYHDNPTLEVMETSSEMQEKKVVSLNGELGDSWIVPLDNLTKDDLDEEEDTHL